MKLLHTSDWHLGKTLKGANLLDDQVFILERLFDIINDTKPDAVLITGDIYDRAVPPADAVELFDATLNRLAERNLPTLIIAGNHDSSTRLNFGSKLFAQQKIHIATKTLDEPAQIVLADDFGDVYFSLIPYFEPSAVADGERLTYNAANQLYVERARQKIPAGKRSVAMAHVFLTGGVESESERKFVGGSANVDAQIFSGYDYVALGHLHRPQKISAEHIRYAGSPLKYSFSEADHKKSVTIVELDGAGAVKTEKISLTPKRDLVVAKGTFNELLQRPTTHDYAQIVLTDDAYIYDTERLREVYPNFLEVKHENHLASYDEAASNFCKEEPVSEQFAKFFEEITGAALTDDERAAFEDFLRELESAEREA